jgi:hypothetical protein
LAIVLAENPSEPKSSGLADVPMLQAADLSGAEFSANVAAFD